MANRRHAVEMGKGLTLRLDDGFLCPVAKKRLAAVRDSRGSQAPDHRSSELVDTGEHRWVVGCEHPDALFVRPKVAYPREGAAHFVCAHKRAGQR